MQTSFGRKQLGKPVPASIAFNVMLISAISAVIQAWLLTATYIPNNISNIISSLLALVIAVSNAILPFYGVNVSSDTVPTDQVKSIEDKPSN